MIRDLVICCPSLCFALAFSSMAAEGRWTMLAPLPRAMTEIVATAANGKLYVMAGLQRAGPLGAVDEYDAGADRWTAKRPMPVPAHHVMTAAYKDRIYVFGGFVRPPGGEGWLPIDNAWEYDPRTDSWKALAPMPTRRGAGTAVEFDGRIYVIGGANAPDAAKVSAESVLMSVGTVEEYDPMQNRWRSRKTMPTPRNHFTAGAVGGKIYAIGGRIGDAKITRSSNTDVVEEYDPATDEWNLRARMPTARSGTAGAVYEGRIFVLGGEYQTDQVMMAFRACEAYRPTTDRWEELPHMQAPRHGLAAALLGTRLHALGGDFQSAGVPGVEAHLASHEALEIPKQ